MSSTIRDRPDTPLATPSGVGTPPALDSLRTDLDTIGDKLFDQWSLALALDDSHLVERLAAVSHNVHRAASALVAPAPMIGDAPPDTRAGSEPRDAEATASSA